MNSKARDFRAGARASLKGYWAVSVLICLVAVILGGIGSGVSTNSSTYTQSDVYDLVGAGQALTGVFTHPEVIYSVLHTAFVVNSVFLLAGCAVMVFVGSTVKLGVCTYFCRLNLGERPSFSTLFGSFHIFWKATGLRLFMGLFIILWSLLLIVPGIIAALSYAMAPYLMAENPGMGIREAVNQSKTLMDGNKGRLFCLGLSFIGWEILSVFTWGILQLWIMPYTEAAYAALYLELTGRQYGMPGGNTI